MGSECQSESLSFRHKDPNKNCELYLICYSRLLSLHHLSLAAS